jgi:aryl-alcohol dehydrogenase-like predicted oxidoreductase
MSEIGLGTAAIGRPQYINIRQEEAAPFSLPDFRAKGMSVLNAAYEQGIRYFDTAPGYGLAEQLMIDWLEASAKPGISVATKWGYTYTANFAPNAAQHEVKEHSLKKLNEQWSKSAGLLPWLRVYQIHSATLESGVLDNEAVLNQLAAVKAEHHLLIGLTTSGVGQKEVIEKALAVEVNGVILFDAFQSTYNILDQGLADMLKVLKTDGKKVIIKEALANGRMFPNERYLHYKPLYNQLKQIAQKYDVGIDAVALRFCMDSVLPDVVLSGAANTKHLVQNLKALDFKLSPEELDILYKYSVPIETYWAERKQLSWN